MSFYVYREKKLINNAENSTVIAAVDSDYHC